MIYNILFAVVGIGLIALGLSLVQDLEYRIEGLDALVATLEEKLNDSGGEE